MEQPREPPSSSSIFAKVGRAENRKPQSCASGPHHIYLNFLYSVRTVTLNIDINNFDVILFLVVFASDVSEEASKAGARNPLNNMESGANARGPGQQ